MTERRYSMKKPCRECPFGRKTAPGTLGGRDASIYVGQGHGPFWLPCHMADGYSQNKTDFSLPQCAGAAMYRNLTGRSEVYNDGGALHRLEGDPELAFSSPAEFLSHHEGISLEEATARLEETTPDDLLALEIDKLKRGERY